MRVGLIDVDSHNFPNLCVMKISAYHKQRGDRVEWWSPDVPYYDLVYMSKVFSNAYSPDIPEPTNAGKSIKGGTGYAISLINGKEVYDSNADPPLPAEIEHIYPDYSLYPQYTGYGKPLRQQTAFGFLSRGCPRACSFCIVASKEGCRSRKVADISEFWHGQGNICLSDPNILACPERDELLCQLEKTGARIEFNQGLDARFLTPALAERLAGMRLRRPHFAMDSMNDLDAVAAGLRLYVSAYRQIHGSWNDRNAMVFCLTNFNTTHEQDMQRIRLIQECECSPYVMIYNKTSAPKITRRLQRWTNNPFAYAASGRDFLVYQKKTYKQVMF